MNYQDMLLRIKPIPEVEKAIVSLIDSKEDTCASFGGEGWYETPDGESVTFLESSEVSNECFEVEDNEDDLVYRISGMPIFLLHFYPLRDHRWWLLLDMYISCVTSDIHEPSQYSLFRQSTFAPLFREDYEVQGIKTVSRYIGQDIDVAARLISYFIRYYDYESKIPECIR